MSRAIMPAHQPSRRNAARSTMFGVDGLLGQPTNEAAPGLVESVGRLGKEVEQQPMQEEILATGLTQQ
jgi:hypothetical protein